METKSYPRRDLMIERVAVLCRCANCGEPIEQCGEHYTDRHNRYHRGCEPQSKAVIKTVVVEDQMDITKDGAA